MPKDSPFRSVWTDLMQVPFRQGWCHVGDVATRYIEAGPRDGPAIVMIHGTGGSWETFCANIGPFSERMRVIAYDCVGSGLSDKPDYPYDIACYCDHLIGLMDELGVRRATLLGVSLGAWIAARFAVDHPDRIDALISCSTAGLLADQPTMTTITTQRTAAVDHPDWETIRAVIRHLVYDDENCLGDIVRVRQYIYEQPGMAAVMQRILVLQDPEVRQKNCLTEDEYRSIGAPALFIATPDSPDVYLDTTLKAAALVPDSTVVEIRRAAHWPHFERPVEFNAAALEFVERVQEHQIDTPPASESSVHEQGAP